MTLHEGLAERVAGLRQRLEEIERISRPAGAPAEPEDDGLRRLRRDLQYLQGRSAHIDARMTELCPEMLCDLGIGRLPRQLAWRTRRLLLRGRDIITGLKRLSEHLDTESERVGDSLGDRHRETLALTELTLRAVQAFPESTSEQIRLCDGLERGLAIVEQRVATLRRLIRRRRALQERVRSLAQVFTTLVQGRPVLLRALYELAETLLVEAQQGEPLHWPRTMPEHAAEWAATHALTLAQVVARVASHAHEAGAPRDVVLAALLCDAGMAALPTELLQQTESLSEEQRRLMESHVGLSADAARRIAPQESWLVDAIRQHHERMDGTGHPATLMGRAIRPQARLLAVCDTYAALASPRAHRPAATPRAALTETLREGERGRLDLAFAQHLLELSFFPIGTTVELSDGRIGVVVATHPLHGQLHMAARPIVQLLVDGEGEPVPWPTHADLVGDPTRHVVRVLGEEEATERLAGTM